MPRARRTIKNITAQRDRALTSIREERAYNPNDTQPRNVYVMGQRRTYWTQEPQGSDKRYKAGTPGEFAARKYNKRVRQINQAAENEISKLQKQGKDYRAARKAQGLSAG